MNLPKDRERPYWSTLLPDVCSPEEEARFLKELHAALPDLCLTPGACSCTVEALTEAGQLVRLEHEIAEALRHDAEHHATIADLSAQLAAASERIRALEAERDTPEIHDFAKGLVREAVHQRARWSSDHDAGKTPADWFWLIGYLAQKAMTSQMGGDIDKALHHVITTAAAMANWHAQMLGAGDMRPGISEEKGTGWERLAGIIVTEALILMQHEQDTGKAITSVAFKNAVLALVPSLSEWKAGQ
jgi:hypothetical protein